MKTILLFLLCLPCFAQCTRIRCERVENGATITSHGTATCFDGKWITCAHVVEKAESVLVESRGSWIRCDVNKKDSAADLAYLIPDGKVDTVDEHAHGTFCYGSAEGRKIERFVASFAASILIGEHLDIKGMAHGLSGSAITVDGQTVAIVTGFAALNGKEIKDCARFVSAELVKKFLKLK